MKTIQITEGNKVFNLRPQLHVMIISPFGTFKSSLTKEFEKDYNPFIVPVDDFTKPGIEGTISKDGEYIPPLLMKLGGKLLIIDEWNNVDYLARQALLGILENQRFSRNIGFKVKKPFKYHNKYGVVNIVDNSISGEMIFSCLAYAMEYPVFTQKDKALLSRFTPLFIEPSLDYIKAHTAGLFETSIKDYSNNIMSVSVSDEAYKEFHKAYYDYIISERLVPEDTDDYGYLSRVMSDIIRFGVYNHLSKGVVDAENINIISSESLNEMIPYASTLLRQFSNPKTKGKFYQYKQLRLDKPGMPQHWYAEILGVSRQLIFDYDNKLGKSEKIEL